MIGQILIPWLWHQLIKSGCPANSFSGTPSYSHPVNTATSLSWPLYFGLDESTVSHFLFKERQIFAPRSWPNQRGCTVLDRENKARPLVSTWQYDKRDDLVCLFLFRLWEAGWKGRYYQNKFQLSENDEGYDDFRKKVVRFCNTVLHFSKVSAKFLFRTRK